MQFEVVTHGHVTAVEAATAAWSSKYKLKVQHSSYPHQALVMETNRMALQETELKQAQAAVKKAAAESQQFRKVESPPLPSSLQH